MHNRFEKSADRRLREEQDAAYSRSLAADEAKEQARLQAALQSAPASKPENPKDTQQKTARRRVATKKEPLGPEPTGGIALSFQLPSGKRLQRRFLTSDPSRKLYAFVRASFTDDDDEDSFVIKSLFPATVVPDGDGSLDSHGLSTPQKLFVELLETKREESLMP